MNVYVYRSEENTGSVSLHIHTQTFKKIYICNLETILDKPPRIGRCIGDVTEYAVPVFYILGRDDWQTPSSLAAEYFEKTNAPSKGLFWIENARHMTDMDNPSDFFKAVREIISQQ